MDNETLPVALGVDIGGTKVAIGLVNTRGDLVWPIANHRVPFDDLGVANPDGILDIIEPYVHRMLASDRRIHGVGLSVCGNIDTDTGEAVLVPNLHWRNVPFGSMAKRRFGLPIYSATDVRQAALGEWKWGTARGLRYFAWVTIGTGFGAYLVLDGKLYGGVHGFAGNFGHNVMEVNGYPCGCGQRGCVETFVAGPAIARAGQNVLDKGESPLLAELAEGGLVTTEMVFRAEAAGDKACAEILSDVVQRIAISLAGLVNTLDLEAVVLGGGVMKAGTKFLKQIDDCTRLYLMTEEARRDLRLVAESLPNAAAMGAAADVFQRVGDLPAS